MRMQEFWDRVGSIYIALYLFICTVRDVERKAYSGVEPWGGANGRPSGATLIHSDLMLLYSESPLF